MVLSARPLMIGLAGLVVSTVVSTGATFSVGAVEPPAQPSRVTGSVWLEADADWRFDRGEAAVTTTPVFARDETGQSFGPSYADANGRYEIDVNGAVGTKIAVSLQQYGPMSPNPPSGHGPFQIVPLVDGVAKANFATIDAPTDACSFGPDVACTKKQNDWSGLMLDDVDGDGIFDPNDPPLAGVVVELVQQGTVVKRAQTDSKGWYRISLNTAATDLVLRVRRNQSKLSGKMPFNPQQNLVFGGNTVSRATDQAWEFDANNSSGMRTVSYAFGPPFVAIGGSVWAEVDGDNRLSAGDDPTAQVLGLPGYTCGSMVQLFADKNADGTIAGVETTPIAERLVYHPMSSYVFDSVPDPTDPNGIRIRPVRPGSYAVGVHTDPQCARDTLPMSVGVAYDSRGRLVDAIVDNSAVSGVDHGLQQTSGFYTDGILTSTFTVTPDSAPLQERYPVVDPYYSDWDTDVSRMIPHIPDDVTDLTRDIGVHWQVFGTRVFADGNGDGMHTHDEAFIDGATVELLNDRGLVLERKDSGEVWEGGYAMFTRVPPGSYRLRVTLPSGYRSTIDIPDPADYTCPNLDRGLGTKRVASTALITVPALGCGSNVYTDAWFWFGATPPAS